MRHDRFWNFAKVSRRGAVRLIAALAVRERPPLFAWTPEDLELDRVWPSAGDPVEPATESLYRVDATILLLSVPVLRRSSVGDARLASRQAREGTRRRLWLEFAAGSDPARAHGLNRSGWIREAIDERDATLVWAAVFGIMTDSPEQSVKEARGALSSTAGAQPFVAIDSASLPGETRSRIARFRAQYPKAPRDERLPEQARRSLQTGALDWRRTDWTSEHGAAPMTFLYAILRSIEQDAGSVHSEYVYNEDRFLLRLDKSPDPAFGRRFQSSGLSVDPERVLRFRGTIQNHTRRFAPFRFQFWWERGAPTPLPIRVEFQPRSFLRLEFERLAETQ